MSNSKPVLISHHLCPYVQRAVIALTEKSVAFERVYIDLSAKPDWFSAISPLGKVPLLKAEGAVIFESSVILEYLEETQPHPLHPVNPVERARHRGWIEFASAILNAIAGLYNAPDEAAFGAKATQLRKMFERVEAEVGPGPLFAGDRMSLVDAAFAPVFRYFDVFDALGDFGILTGLDATGRWRATLARRDSVRDAVTPDYSRRLAAFLAARSGHIASLVPVAV